MDLVRTPHQSAGVHIPHREKESWAVFDERIVPERFAGWQWVAAPGTRQSNSPPEVPREARFATARPTVCSTPLNVELHIVDDRAVNVGCKPGKLVTLMAVDVSGSRLFRKLSEGACDAKGEWSFSATVPPGLSGLTVTFQAFGEIDGKLVASDQETIVFL